MSKAPALRMAVVTPMMVTDETSGAPNIDRLTPAPKASMLVAMARPTMTRAP